MFNQLGCGECHVPSLGGVALYSDLLLHDMGRALDDGFTQAAATGHDWRTFTSTPPIRLRNIS